MRIKYMHVENFRGLVDERIEFDESMTVLAGGNGGGNKLLNGLLQTAKTTLQGQSPQMVLSFLASQPGFEAWFEANKNKTVGELVGQIGK